MMGTQPLPQLLMPEEAADLLRISRRTVYD